MSRYSVYTGKFLCQSCKSEVYEARFYNHSYDFTWMCNDKHLSKVNMYKKRILVVDSGVYIMCPVCGIIRSNVSPDRHIEEAHKNE